MNERRHHERWDGRVLVDLEDAQGNVFEAVGLNVSAGGLCLIFPDSPEPKVGDEYDVSFQLPALNERVRNAVQVRWVDSLRSKVCGAAFLQGMRAIEVYTLNELLKGS